MNNMPEGKRLKLTSLDALLQRASSIGRPTRSLSGSSTGRATRSLSISSISRDRVHSDVLQILLDGLPSPVMVCLQLSSCCILSLEVQYPLVFLMTPILLILCSLMTKPRLVCRRLVCYLCQIATHGNANAF